MLFFAVFQLLGICLGSIHGLMFSWYDASSFCFWACPHPSSLGTETPVSPIGSGWEPSEGMTTPDTAVPSLQLVSYSEEGQRHK